MSNKNSDGGGAIAVALGIVIWIIVSIPKTVWIVLGVIVATVLIVWVAVRTMEGLETRREELEAQAKTKREEQAAADKRQRDEKARRERQRRIDTLGTQNAALMESALAAVKRVTASEAARAGWLGDVDFTVDLKGITENFERAHALRGVTDKLSALDKPGPDDRKILAEARATTAKLEGAAIERINLIGKCANEAQLIDKSLQAERQDALVAEQRADLHAKLSAMLYGIEATPNTAPADSAVEAVMARVQAYRDIKNQIPLAGEPAGQ